MRARGPGGQSLAEGTVCARLYRGCPSSNRATDHLVRSSTCGLLAIASIGLSITTLAGCPSVIHSRAASSTTKHNRHPQKSGSLVVLTLRQRPSRLGGLSGWAPRNEGARHAIAAPMEDQNGTGKGCMDFLSDLLCGAVR
jgi:hypothetical protein